MAISHTEASEAWNYTAEEIELFSTPGWWEDASPELIKKGYAYNTCDVWGCSADVRGIMQFADTTFALYADELREILGREPDRRLIPDSIYAAALKIKNDSGTGPDECQDWSDAVVREVARKYCGSCDSTFCPNYCNIVLAYYHDYQNSLDIILEPPDNKNAQLAEQVSIIMQNCLVSTSNPEGYINPNTYEQAKECISSSDLSDNEKTTLNNMIDNHITQYNTLQCVGFVRVVENLTGGRFPICGQAAWQWGRESCWQGGDYTFLGSNIDLVREGDIAVKPTSSPGHIGFVSKRIDQESGIARFRFTSAIGGLGGSYNGGNITIMKVPASYFTDRGYVFIRRND